MLMDHGDGALASDWHMWWHLLVVLAEVLTWELHAGGIDEYSGGWVLNLLWLLALCLQWVLRWGTESTVLHLASLGHHLTQSSIDVSVTSLFVEHVEFVSSRDVLSLPAIGPKPWRCASFCATTLPRK